MRTWAWYSSGMACIGAMGSAIVLYVGGRDVLAGNGFTAGDLVTFVLYVSMFYTPVTTLHGINQLYQAGRASGERVSEILDAATEKYGEPDGKGRSFARAVGAMSNIATSRSPIDPDVAALHD